MRKLKLPELRERALENGATSEQLDDLQATCATLKEMKAALITMISPDPGSPDMEPKVSPTEDLSRLKLPELRKRAAAKGVSTEKMDDLQEKCATLKEMKAALIAVLNEDPEEVGREDQWACNICSQANTASAEKCR